MDGPRLWGAGSMCTRRDERCATRSKAALVDRLIDPWCMPMICWSPFKPTRTGEEPHVVEDGAQGVVVFRTELVEGVGSAWLIRGDRSKDPVPRSVGRT